MAYQEWASRQMEMATEDAKRMFAGDGRAFVVQRLRPNGHDRGNTQPK